MSQVLNVALGSTGLALSLADDSAGEGGVDAEVLPSADVERVEVYLSPGARPTAILRARDGTQRTFNVGQVFVAAGTPSEEAVERPARSRRKGGDA